MGSDLSIAYASKLKELSAARKAADDAYAAYVTAYADAIYAAEVNYTDAAACAAYDAADAAYDAADAADAAYDAYVTADAYVTELKLLQGNTMTSKLEELKAAEAAARKVAEAAYADAIYAAYDAADAAYAAAAELKILQGDK